MLLQISSKVIIRIIDPLMKGTNIENQFEELNEYFSNVKFAYKERKSKMFFYDSILLEEAVAIDTKVLEQAKKNLQEVKAEYREREKKSKTLCLELDELDRNYKEKEAERMLLQEKLDMLKKNSNKLNLIKKHLSMENDMKTQLDTLIKENTEKEAKLDKTRAFLENDEVKEAEKIEGELIAKMNEMNAKVKRMTLINTETDIEEIYFWYKALAEMYKSLFGNISYEISNEGRNYKISFNFSSKNIKEATITLVDKNLKDVQLTGDNLNLFMEEYIKVKELCIKTNDPRLFLLFAFKSSLNQ